jgi:hypothetical protein
MSKTNQLVKLLEQRSYNYNSENPYPYVAGYLSAVLERFEKEYASAELTKLILDEEIARVKNLNLEAA